MYLKHIGMECTIEHLKLRLGAHVDSVYVHLQAGLELENKKISEHALASQEPHFQRKLYT